MSKAMLAYADLGSPIHKLTGATKLIFFVLWAVAAMITFDTRSLLAMFVISLIIFKASRVKFRQISFVLYLILFFLLLNNIAIFLFSPYEGVKIYGTEHEWVHIVGIYSLTAEQAFYQFNVTLKYFTVIPMALLFFLTTNPSEFAASLSRIGISYRISYAVAIALRYIPDVQRDFWHISFAQQARGLDMSRKEKLHVRVKNALSILLPLILSSLQRIETISAAMELRSFGRKDKRTWYSARPFTAGDYAAIALAAAIFIVSAVLTFYDGSRFYNPF